MASLYHTDNLSIDCNTNNTTSSLLQQQQRSSTTTTIFFYVCAYTAHTHATQFLN
eukprot:m.110730 g.110730  ORF g.110730 m.110730 type:complete len:55 (-) comp28063_c0_seq1:71-235(-)